MAPDRWHAVRERGLVIVAAVLVVAAFPLAASVAPALTLRPASLGEDVCPADWHQDPARAARIHELLATTRAGRDLLRRSAIRLRTCFAEIAEPAITAGSVLVLDERTSDAESAARLGHLLLHAVEGLPLPERTTLSRPCDAVVDAALRAEARAHGLELELRRELGVRRPRRAFPFERQYWETPTDERLDLVRSFFERHPEGAPGVPGFVDAYQQRCEQLQRR